MIGTGRPGREAGGGLELAMARTLRIAAPHTTMALPEVKLGLLPAYAGTQFLPAIVGKARALEIMVTGRTLSTEEALAIGLVHRVADDDSPLIAQALGFGREVVRWSPGALSWIRRCVDAAGPQHRDHLFFGESTLSHGLLAGELEPFSQVIWWSKNPGRSVAWVLFYGRDPSVGKDANLQRSTGSELTVRDSNVVLA